MSSPINDPFWRWHDYIGIADGMVYFEHGAYQVKDIARVMYPGDPARQTWFILKYSK